MIDKFILLGNVGSGKTSLLVTLEMGMWMRDHIPCIFDEHHINHQGTSMNFLDTQADSGHARIRPLSYTNNSFFLLCFSINNHQSFLDIEQTWLPEVKHHYPNAPVMLVGMKSDLPRNVSKEDINELQEKILAQYKTSAQCIEVSSLQNENLSLLMDNLKEQITIEPVRADLAALALEARKASFAAKFGKFALPLSNKLPVAQIIDRALERSTIESMKIELKNLYQPNLENNVYAQRARGILAKHNIDPNEFAPPSNVQNASKSH